MVLSPVKSGYLLPALQVPEPQRSVTRNRDGTAAVGNTATAPTEPVWPSSVRIVWPPAEPIATSALARFDPNCSCTQFKRLGFSWTVHLP